MVSGVSNTQMNQIQNMYQMRNGQGGQGPKGKGLGQLMRALPQDVRENLSQTLQSMDQTQRKDIVSQLKQLDVANMSQDELISQINTILNPQTSADNFSIYA